MRRPTVVSIMPSKPPLCSIYYYNIYKGTVLRLPVQQTRNNDDGGKCRTIVRRWFCRRIKVTRLPIHIMTCSRTSIPKRLFPQQVGQFVGPRLFDVLRHGHQRVRISWFAFPEPYLEFRIAVADFGSEPDITGFYTVLVHVQVQILRQGNTN